MILDHIEGLEFTEEQAEQNFEARMALARLGEGLFSLYKQVGELATQIRAEATRENVTAALAGGILENKPMGWLSCIFQWHAVSACNYAQLLGWLVTRNTDSAREYMSRVMPRVAN